MGDETETAPHTDILTLPARLAAHLLRPSKYRSHNATTFDSFPSISGTVLFPNRRQTTMWLRPLRCAVISGVAFGKLEPQLPTIN